MLAILLGTNEIGVILAVAGVIFFLTSARSRLTGGKVRQEAIGPRRIKLSQLDKRIIIAIALLAIVLVIVLAWVIARYVFS